MSRLSGGNLAKRTNFCPNLLLYLLMILIQTIVFIVCFGIIWYASGKIVAAVERLSHKVNLSSFATSFFILGILTSIPEFSVGLNSIASGQPEIFVGNLIGASIVLFILVIPILAIFGNGVKLAHQLTEKNLIFSLLVIAAPVFLMADNLITRTEGVFMILIYLVLTYFIEKKKGLLEKVKDELTFDKKNTLEDLLILIAAALAIFLSSKFIVGQTPVYSALIGLSPFLISLVLISIGTNLPELTLAIKSVILKRKQVVLGDYLGSAAANTFLFGLLTILNGRRINISTYSFRTMIFMLLSLGLFYSFSRTKNDISRKEGLILLFVYFIFVFVEILL